MTTMQYAGPIEVVTISIEPGEMLLETIREAIKKHSIKNGVVVSGIGALKSFPLRSETHCDSPPIDLSSLNGIIADGEPHLHAVISCADGEVHSGHLGDGSEILKLAEIAILVFNDLQMTRHLDKQRGIRLLGPKE